MILNPEIEAPSCPNIWYPKQILFSCDTWS